MLITTVIDYTWDYICLRCERSLINHQRVTMPGGIPLDSDPNAPRHACLCLSPSGGWRLEDCDNSPAWTFECRLGHKWTESRQNRAIPKVPFQACRFCYPNGMWHLWSHWITEQRFLNGSPVSEETGRHPSSGKPTMTGSEASNTESPRNDGIDDAGNSVLQDSEVSRLLHRSPTPSLKDSDIPGLVPQFDLDDSDTEMQEARSFPPHSEEDFDDETLGSNPTGQDDNSGSSEKSTSMDLDDLSLEDLSLEGYQEIEEEEYPDHTDEDAAGLGVSSDMGAENRVSMWSPETPTDDSEEDLIPRNSDSDSEAETEIEDQPRSPRSPTSRYTRDSALSNYARIQEIRNFLSIPPSLPSRSIPTFYNSHERVGGSLQTGVFLTRGRLSSKRPFVWLYSAHSQRFNEVYRILNDIEWDDELLEMGESAGDETWGFTSASTLNGIVLLSDEDEEFFWEQAENSQASPWRLVAETQQPRLPTDPGSTHRVSSSSALSTELVVRVRPWRRFTNRVSSSTVLSTELVVRPRQKSSDDH